MALIAGRDIEKVKVIDDDHSFRQTMAATIKEAKLEPLVVAEPLGELEAFVTTTLASSQAALCDHHLRQRAVYSTFNGAEAVAQLYKKKFPAVLCTAWDKANVDEIRGVRRYLPSLLRPSELDPDSFVAGLSACIDEFGGKFRQNREPSRALVRVEDEEADLVYVVVPAFSPKDVIRLPRKYLPEDVIRAIVEGTRRLHAFVNLGAEAQEELFFERWETS